MLCSAFYLFVKVGTNVPVHFTLFALLTDGTQQGGGFKRVFWLPAECWEVFCLAYNPLASKTDITLLFSWQVISKE